MPFIIIIFVFFFSLFRGFAFQFQYVDTKIPIDHKYVRRLIRTNRQNSCAKLFKKESERKHSRWAAPGPQFTCISSCVLNRIVGPYYTTKAGTEERR
ncbi:hypothetical protein MIMGU_mgv1a017033mg [Erythranthe guttata]|uniref:Secreted protein n=1 Tax=Erythranthe guttata TaxID=4155 RepID=A0A022QGW7_ERYGU|nr:hypothetical protein MIMGU_mgv1a017033mg [Erythranthe guttata]